MSDYKRILEPGGEYFFTVNIQNRQDDLLTRYIDVLRQSYSEVSKRHPFRTLAICVLPDEELRKDIKLNAAKWNKMKWGER